MKKISLILLLFFFLSSCVSMTPPKDIACQTTSRNTDQKKITKIDNTANYKYIAVHKEPPLYPIKAFQEKIEGWVKMEFKVNNEGTVVNLRVVDSYPNNIFDDAALNAVSKWLFKLKNDQKLDNDDTLITTIRFKLKK